MPNPIDVSGQKFNRLTATRPKKTRLYGKSRVMWLCRCECGGKARATVDQLRSGAVKSCGCLRSEKVSAACLKHGHSRKKSRVYRCWISMTRRCRNKNATGYRLWGGRGVSVCDRWLGPDGFANFLADMGEPPTSSHSIDRHPNKNGNYELGNCRWATSTEQNNNTRRNRNITHNGVTKTLTEWARHVGIRPRLLQARLARLGWSVERSLTEPPNPRRQAAALSRYDAVANSPTYP